ncbi:MAG TPA: DUF3575 domain-containing protein [Vicinamibacterales bacterium]
MRRTAVVLVVCLMAVMFPSASASAQTLTPSRGAQTISANPFLLMYKIFNVEYERKHTSWSTWGVSSSMFGFGDADYRNISTFYRYYPQHAALNGFFIGGRAGVHRVSSDGAAGTFAGAGVEVGYDWLFGPQRNFAVGMGMGVTRLFGGALSGASLTVPTLRLVNVGWSF